MILSKSYLKSQMIKSPLHGQSVLKPKGTSSSRPIMFTLALTSLIDAFSILVIFLLIQGPSNGQEITIGKNVQLPKVQSMSAMDGGVSVRIENGKYYVEDQLTSSSDLVRRLNEVRENVKSELSKSLIVQADRRSDFDLINPIIQAGALVGFEQIKFAVLPRRGSS